MMSSIMLLSDEKHEHFPFVLNIFPFVVSFSFCTDHIVVLRCKLFAFKRISIIASLSGASYLTLMVHS